MRCIRKTSAATRSLEAQHGRVSASSVAAVIALALVIATSGIAVTASAASHVRGHHVGRTIYLHSTFVSATVNSAGNGGAGDVVANLWDFTTRDGQTGHADISCTSFPNGETLCHAAFVFPKGQIEFQVGGTPRGTTFVAAVIGGTGIYDGAKGEAVNVITAPGVIDRVIHLVPDDQ